MKVFRVFGISLFIFSIVQASFQDIPSGIPVGNFSFMERSSGSKSQEDGAHDMELVMKVPGMTEVLGWEGDLETTHSESKGHGIKVDVTWEWLISTDCGQVSHLIFENWDLDFCVLSSSRLDAFGHGGVSGVISDAPVINEPALSDFIHEFFFGLFIPDSNEGDARNCQCDFAFLLEYSVFVPDRQDDFIQVKTCVVGICGSHLEHPASILTEEREL